MKKLLSIFVAAAILLTNISVLGADASKTEQVLKLVKERIDSTEMYDRFNSAEAEYDGETRYEFNWSTSKEETYKYMNVSANDNGLILSYSIHDGIYDDSKISVNKLSSDDAIKRATELVNALNPSLSGRLVLKKHNGAESLYNNDFGFEIIHIENGIEIIGDNGYAMYNAESDSLKSFYIDYTESPELDSVDNAISVEEAQKGFMENIGLKLIYQKIYGENDDVRFIPIYKPNTKPNQYINANTNKIEGIRVPDRRNSLYATEQDTSGSGGSGLYAFKQASLTEAELSEIEAVSSLLSKDELIKLAKTNKYMSVPAGYKLNNYRLMGDRLSNDYFASIEFSNDNKGDFSWISFTINAKTGEITQCWRSNANTNKNAKLNVAAAKRLAAEIAKNMAGEKLAEYKENENEDGENNGIFSYTRYVNGAEVVSDTLDIRIGNDNKLESYRISYSNNEFPPIENVIGEAAAGAALFDAVEYRMVYMPQTKSEKSTDFDIYVPVYTLDDSKPQMIDAFSGKLLGYDGKEYVEFSIPAYDDLNGHYAESAIYELAKYGICFDGESFRPDEKITQKDFMKLVVDAFGYGSEAYITARRMNIIKDNEVNPDAEVTREMAAVHIIRALGIEEYANLEGVFVKPFADVTSNYGAIGILSAMGVFRGDEKGLFNPDTSITRADSAMIIYNYLSR